MMSQENPYGGPRIAGVLVFIVTIATLIIAMVNTPLGDWGTWGFVLGALILFVGLTFLYQAAKDRMNIVGRNTSGKTNLIISLIGLIAVVIAVVANVVSQSESGWTVAPILTTGIFVALGIMFAAGIPASRAKIAAGG